MKVGFSGQTPARSFCGAQEADAFFKCRADLPHELDGTGGKVIECTDYLHRAGTLQFRDDLTVEIRVREAQDDQLHRSYRHSSAPLAQLWEGAPGRVAPARRP